MKKYYFSSCFLLLFAFPICIPLCMLFSGAFMGNRELMDCIAPALGMEEGSSSWNFIPLYPTLSPLVEILFDCPEFFKVFWNSCFQAFAIISGQLLIAIPSAWGFSHFTFRGKSILYWIYIVLMILPFQVTMVSNFLVLDYLKLMDTHFSIILPAIFSTFPVFIMTKFFSSISSSLLEAASLDGANHFQIFLKIGLPLGKSGIISVIILSFLEYWSFIEPPLLFLTDKSKFPLSLYLPYLLSENINLSFVASVITIIPALLLFLYGQDYLERGIQACNLKI